MFDAIEVRLYTVITYATTYATERKTPLPGYLPNNNKHFRPVKVSTNPESPDDDAALSPKRAMKYPITSIPYWQLAYPLKWERKQTIMG